MARPPGWQPRRRVLMTRRREATSPHPPPCRLKIEVIDEVVRGAGRRSRSSCCTSGGHLRPHTPPVEVLWFRGPAAMVAAASSCFDDTTAKKDMPTRPPLQFEVLLKIEVRCNGVSGRGAGRRPHNSCCAGGSHLRPHTPPVEVLWFSGSAAMLAAVKLNCNEEYESFPLAPLCKEEVHPSAPPSPSRACARVLNRPS